MFTGNKKNKEEIGVSNFMFFKSFIVFTYLIMTNKMYWLSFLLIAFSILCAKNNMEALKVYKENKSYQKRMMFFYISLIFTTPTFVYFAEPRNGKSNL